MNVQVLYIVRLLMNVQVLYIIRWTGSNNNPHNNDGQGRAGTDRSNIVLQKPQAYSEGSGVYYTNTAKYGHWGRSYPDHLNNATLPGMSAQDLRELAILNTRMLK